MITFYLPGVLRPRYLIVAAVIAPVLARGFVDGGTEVGSVFGIAQLFRLWYVVTPILAILVVISHGSLWNTQRLHSNWELARPTPRLAVQDMVVNLVTGYLVFASLVLAIAAFALVRLGLDGPALANLVLVTGLGPLLGGYLVLGLGYLAGLATRQGAVRIAVVVVLALADASNQLPIAPLSLAGTTRMVPWSRWGLVDGVLPADAIVSPSASFAAGRIGLAIVLTAALVLVAWRRAAQGIHEPGRAGAGSA